MPTLHQSFLVALPEYRGANATRSSGSYCGIVEAKDNDNCSVPDVTTPPPYVWRP